MDEKLLGMKEIYEVVLKPTSNIEIAGQVYEAGQPLITFDNLQIAEMREVKQHIDARGGYENQAWVSWDICHEVNINFQQGVMSKMHLALLGNSDIAKAQTVEVPKMETLELNDNLQATLTHLPVRNGFYAYLHDTGEVVTNMSVSGQTVTINQPIVEPYTAVDFFYNFSYTNANVISIGRQMINGYLELTAKTRLKDDMEGKTVTGIFKVPKLKLMSDFSIRLGKDATPSVGNFLVRCFPVGSKGEEKVMDFITLNDDIDSDF